MAIVTFKGMQRDIQPTLGFHREMQFTIDLHSPFGLCTLSTVKGQQTSTEPNKYLACYTTVH